MKLIDVHAHIVVPEAEAIARGADQWRAESGRLAREMGPASLEQNRRLFTTVYADAFKFDNRLAAMDEMHIDVQVVSTPTHFYYWADRELTARITEAINQEVARTVARDPARFLGLGTVSLQFPELAASQLAQAMAQLGLKGAIISTTTGGTELGDPKNDPFWAAAESLGAVIFIHPAGCALGERLSPFYFSNVIGNPTETTIALASLIFGGVLDRFPRLKLCAAHGGGYFPFYTARFDHGWSVRPESHTCHDRPSEYLKRLWFDSLVYTPEQLGFLIAQAGVSQVVLGTDYPFDMGVSDPIERLEAVSSLSSRDREQILSTNACRLFGIST